MKPAIIVLFAFLTVTAYAIPAETEPPQILKQVNDVGFDGTYESSFETENGIVQEEHGVLKDIADGLQAEEITGSVSYTAPDGTPIHLTYIANENGFQAQGDHLPVPPVDDNTPPPIPPQIVRALEYIALHSTTSAPQA